MCTTRRGQLSTKRIEQLAINKLNYEVIEAFKELHSIPLATATSGSLTVNIEVSEAETDNTTLDNITDLIGIDEQDMAGVGEISDEEED